MTKRRSTAYEPKPFVNIKLGGERLRLEAFGWVKLNQALDMARPAVESLATGVDAMSVALSMPEVLTDLACLATKRDRDWFEEKDISVDELVELMSVIYALNEPELKKLKPRAQTTTPAANSANQVPGNLSQLTKSLQNLSQPAR